MTMTGRISVIILVLSAVAFGRSQGRTKSFFNNDKENDYSSLAITQDMWAQIQSDCGLDVTQMTGTVESSGLHLDGNMFKGSKAKNVEASTVAKVNLQHVVAVLPLHLKQTLLSCLQMESIPVRVFEEENGSSNWYIRYLDSIFSWPDASRRNLGQKHLQDSTDISASGLPLAPVLGEEPLQGSTSIFAPAYPPASVLGEKLLQGLPISAPAYPPASVQDIQSPAYAPEPLSAYTPVSFDEYSDELSAEVPVTPFLSDIYSSGQPSASQQPSASEQPSASTNSAPPLASNKHHIHVPVLVGATATGTFVFALVLLCFYQKRYVVYPGYVDKDKALPSLSLGSSRKSALGGTLDKEQFGSQLCDTNTNQNGKSSSATHNFPMVTHISSLERAQSFGAGRSLEESSAVSADNAAPLLPSPSLKPPPGRDKPLNSGTPAAPPITAGCSPGPPPPPPPPVPFGSATGPPPPIPTSSLRGPPPPPPPKGAGPPCPPQAFPLKSKPSPVRMNQPGNTACDERSGARAGSEASKSKLKPFFWDTVQASPDQSMVWHQISSGSFQFDEDMIENLFGCTAANKNKNFQKKGFSSKDPSHQYIQILDSKKAQNISILLRALNVTTEEVRDALYEGNMLPTELLQTLLKMAPTSQEELKLRLFNGEVSQLGPADRFLKFLVDMPFAFKRLDSLLYKSSVQEEISSIKESLAALEVASRELRSSRLFLKLLEAVLKTGNRMNDGTFRGGAQAFKLDTLLKLADVRGTDGKTTLLHFVVQEIIRSEGRRAARGVSESQLPSVNPQDVVDDSSQETEDYYCSLGLLVVSGLGAELRNVRKAAGLDAEGITSTVSKLGHGLLRTRNFLNTDLKSTEEDSEFHRMLKKFVEDTEVEITKLLEEEKKVMSLVKSTVDYFHGNAGKDEGLRLFVVVRDFLFLLEKTCKEVEKSNKMVGRVYAKREPQKTVAAPSDANKSPSPDIRQLRFPSVAERRADDSTSDDETSP